MPAPVKENKKEHFLDLARFLATISVFCSHAVFLFWGTNKTVQDLFMTPPVDYASGWYDALNRFMGLFRLKLGPFGVALFFLISGFLFLPSFDRTRKPVPFLIKKAVKLYPVYWCGLILTLLLMYFFKDNGKHFIYSGKDILGTASLFRPLVTSSSPSVDGISWYLECLVFFLIAAAFFAKYFPLEKFENFILFSAVLCFLTRLHIFNFYFYTIYILLGVCFSNLRRGFFSFKQFTAAAAVTAMFFYFNIRGNQELLLNYGYALGIFSLLYYFKNKEFFLRLSETKIVKTICALSYPIYVVHGVCGYVIMANLYPLTRNWFLCLMGGVLWTGITATIIHYFVEKKFSSFLIKKLLSSADNRKG